MSLIVTTTPNSSRQPWAVTIAGEEHEDPEYYNKRLPVQSRPHRIISTAEGRQLSLAMKFHKQPLIGGSPVIGRLNATASFELGDWVLSFYRSRHKHETDEDFKLDPEARMVIREFTKQIRDSDMDSIGYATPEDQRIYPTILSHHFHLSAFYQELPNATDVHHIAPTNWNYELDSWKPVPVSDLPNAWYDQENNTLSFFLSGIVKRSTAQNGVRREEYGALHPWIFASALRLVQESLDIQHRYALGRSPRDVAAAASTSGMIRELQDYFTSVNESGSLKHPRGPVYVSTAARLPGVDSPVLHSSQLRTWTVCGFGDPTCTTKVAFKVSIPPGVGYKMD